eukprot:175842_1
MAFASSSPPLFKAQMFQSECEYKGTHPFQTRFMVIDSRLKIVRVYRNEEELRTKDKDNTEKKFKEISLPKAKVSSTLHTVENRENCIKVTADYSRYFYFNDKILAESALKFLQSITASDTSNDNTRYTNKVNISMQHFKFRCLYYTKENLTDFMMVIDIKKALLMLCSLKDGYAKMQIKLKKSEIGSKDLDPKVKNVSQELIKDKPNISIVTKDIYYTFWFYDSNTMQTALMCIQRAMPKTKQIKKTDVDIVKNDDCKLNDLAMNNNSAVKENNNNENVNHINEQTQKLKI